MGVKHIGQAARIVETGLPRHVRHGPVGLGKEMPGALSHQRGKSLNVHMRDASTLQYTSEEHT